jgi:hypothetical protein
MFCRLIVIFDVIISSSITTAAPKAPHLHYPYYFHSPTTTTITTASTHPCTDTTNTIIGMRNRKPQVHPHVVRSVIPNEASTTGP